MHPRMYPIVGRQASCLALLLVGLPACGYASDDGRSGVRAHQGDVVEADILTGAGLVGMAPGKALGVFVEYKGGGEWLVDVSCDTDLSGYLCEWDVYVMATGDEVLEASPRDFEDDWIVEGSDEVALHTYTDHDFDGIMVRTTPGEALAFEVILDALAPVRDTFPERYLEWVGAEGIVHLGAPSNPLVLLPTKP